MAEQTSQPRSFGAAGDSFLADLYKSVGAATTTEKIAALRLKLDGEYNFYAMGGKVNDEMRLAALEYELLEQKGLVELVLA